MSDYLTTRKKANVDFRFEDQKKAQATENTKENRPPHVLTPVRRKKPIKGKFWLK